MSRELRSGRQYDPLHLPTVTKRRTRKGKAKAADDAAGGELMVIPRMNTLTFGSVDPTENFPEVSPAVEVAGTGLARAHGAAVRVRLTPSMYQKVYGRPPPIRAPVRLPSTSVQAVAPTYARRDAALDNDESTFRDQVAADRALESGDAPGSTAANRAPAAIDAPVPTSTPRVRPRGERDESDDDDLPFVTARTSRVRDDDEDVVSFAQYIVENSELDPPSPSERTAPTKKRPRAASHDSPARVRQASRTLSWADEVMRAEGSPGRAMSLPDVDPSWTNPDWSRNDYMSVPDTESERTRTQDSGSVELNALIYEVDADYVFSDEQYGEVLRNLRDDVCTPEIRSQTSGAGPSARRPTPRVTVEDVDDEDDEDWVVPNESTETEQSAAPQSKGKGKASKKKKKKRTRKIVELGTEIDELRGSEPSRQPGRRQSGRFDASRLKQTPQGFRSGGYLELMHGENARRASTPIARESSRGNGPEQIVWLSVHSQDRSESARTDRTNGNGGASGRGPPSEPSDPSDGSDGSDQSSETDSDDDESDPSSSDDDENDRRKLKKKLKRMKAAQKKLKKKVAAQARSGYKAQAPKPYNGEADYDKFELFIFNYDCWGKDTGLGRKQKVRNVGRFLESKASTWYMSNVAPHLNSYDMSAIYQGLFDYCFPPDFKEKMRRNYMREQQRDQSVQDFFAKLDLMRRRLKIAEQQHIHRVWDGAARYIKGEWAIRGITPKDTTLDELRTTALDIERAHKIRRSMEQYDDGRRHSKRKRSRSPDSKGGRKRDCQRSGFNRDQGRRDKCSDSRKESSSNGKGTKHSRDRAEKWQRSKQDSRNPKSAKDAKQRDEYRAANKCFECGEVGHMVKDCPKRNKTRPSRVDVCSAKLTTEDKVRASSVLIQELQKLSDLKESIEVGSVNVEVNMAVPTKKARSVGTQGHIERNATRVKDHARRVPSTLVVQAKLEGESVRVLLDSGSQADLVLTTLVDQLKLERVALTKPLQLQMAMSGSQGTLSFNVHARLEYQDVDEHREFDVGNLKSYDMILGTPFLYQHCIRLSFNPSSVFIGSVKSLPLEGSGVITINSLTTNVFESRMNDLRDLLQEEATDLCKTVGETQLPPFWRINHTIPLIDEEKVYHFRPSRCPEALKPQFEAKAREYLGTGRWELATGINAIPMLFIPKKTKDGTVQLRTVLDKREQNANTKKLSSPLPNIEKILSTVCRHKYRTVLDGKDAYEQIRVATEDVPKTLFHTPMGTMVSLVMQQGDCNAGAMYQGLMNALFAELIGVSVYVYLDDVIIFSDTLEDHVRDIRKVFEILRRKKLYLSPKKMQFFAKVLSILGHIIDEKGIRMDPSKVDSVSKWKTPTTKDQLASYLGALGYLAPNCPGIRIPMGILTKRTGSNAVFRWEGTEERAFREMQRCPD